jgi:hypothetical protein
VGAVGVREIAAQRDCVERVLRELEPGVLDLGDAKTALRHITEMRNMLGAAESRVAKRIADAGEWRRTGHRSPEEALARSTGVSISTAKDALATAERVQSLPVVAEQLNAGKLSPAQAALVSDAAAANPRAERDLVSTAKVRSLKELKDACAKAKQAADPDPAATTARIHRERSLRMWTAADGTAHLHLNTTPAQMAPIKAAIERRTDKIFQQRRQGDAEAREPHEGYAADALEGICTEASGDGAERATDRYIGVVRADHSALVNGEVADGEICEIAGVGPIDPTTARHVLGDSLLYLVITKGTAVANVVNLARGPTRAQRIALLWRNGGMCEMTECPCRAREIDHDIEWAKDKRTLLDNLHSYCDHHHDLKTRGWARLEAPDGTVELVSPDDPRHPGAA